MCVAMIPLISGILLGLVGPTVGLSRVYLTDEASQRHLAVHEQKKQSPGERASAGDAKDVVNGMVFMLMPPRVQLLFRLAVEMTEDNWMRTGPEGAQALKKLFTKSKAVKAKVAERCATPDEDCEWKQDDALFCELLQLAGSDNGLGDPKILENALVAVAGSTSLVGIDWTSRAAMIAKWKKQARVPNLHGNSEFAEIRQRVLSHRYFERLVNRTCLDLDNYRPDCRTLAMDSLFCEAAAQASIIAVGTDAGQKIIFAQMEKQLPQTQSLLGRSPLQRKVASSLEHQLMEDDKFLIEESQEELEQRAREMQEDIDDAKWDAAPRFASMEVST